MTGINRIIDRLEAVADHGLGILAKELDNEHEVAAAAVKVRACNSVTNASAVNLRARLVDAKLKRTEA